MAEKTYKDWLKEMRATGKRSKKNYDGIMKVIKAIPKEFLTEEMCLIFVKKDLENSYPIFLDLIPEEKKTPAVCLAAVEVNSVALEVVPEALKTKDVLLAYLKNMASQQYPHLITMFPKTLDLWNDESFCIEAVSANGHVIQYMPKEKATKEICIIAFKSGRFDLDHFPEEYWQDDKFNSSIVSLDGLGACRTLMKFHANSLVFRQNYMNF